MLRLLQVMTYGSLECQHMKVDGIHLSMTSKIGASLNRLMVALYKEILEY